MKIIVGLGNPGVQYEKTRHNAGFLVLDILTNHPAINSQGEMVSFSLDKKLKARVYFTVHKGEKLVFVKPDTFMNASGVAVANVMNYYKADIADLIVISDDKDLPLGEARVRLSGGSAGQKGLQNIIDTLGTEEFCRVRIGIADSEKTLIDSKVIDTADYVLQKFSDRELPVLEKISEVVVEHLISRLKAKQALTAESLRIA